MPPVDLVKKHIQNISPVIKGGEGTKPPARDPGVGSPRTHKTALRQRARGAPAAGGKGAALGLRDGDTGHKEQGPVVTVYGIDYARKGRERVEGYNPSPQIGVRPRL